MVLVHYVCPVLPPEDAVLGPPDPVTGVRPVSSPAKPQRPKIHPLEMRLPRGASTHADIPTDPVTSLALKPWCIVAVDADPPAHVRLARDPEIRPIRQAAFDRQKVRKFLAARGEVNPPDDPQGVLTRLHPASARGHIPRVAGLGS